MTLLLLLLLTRFVCSLAVHIGQPKPLTLLQPYLPKVLHSITEPNTSKT
jgi:hypothetical protein